MSISRKDYVVIAAAIKEATAAALSAYGSSGEAGAELVARLVASSLKQTQPNFNREVFEKACRVVEVDAAAAEAAGRALEARQLERKRHADEVAAGIRP